MLLGIDTILRSNLRTKFCYGPYQMFTRAAGYPPLLLDMRGVDTRI